MTATVQRRVLTAGVVVTVLLGVGVRCWTHSDLWLDEALSVDIARLSPGGILHALREDGSPPLYYLLLHLWITLFGSSDGAVRSLSSVVSVAALPAAWLLARRLAGPRTGVAALVLLASSPFALRYATETRMYSLLVLEALLGGLALEDLLRTGRTRSAVGLGLATLALAYTHYWSLFLLAVVAGWLAWRGVPALAGRTWWARRRDAGPPEPGPAHRRGLLAMVGAGVLFLPQVPTLLFQVRHTGTPWAAQAQPRVLLDTVLGWGGPGSYVWAIPLGTLLLGFALLGWFAVRDADGATRLRTRDAAPGPALAGFSAGVLLLATLVTIVGQAGFVTRYTAVAFPGWLLLAAVGAGRLPPRLLAPLLALAAVLGLQTGRYDAWRQRTEAGAIAEALGVSTVAGDVVVYCPDQLAPAVHRLLPPGRVEIAAGDPAGPGRVDWVDYAQRNAALTAGDLALEADRLAGPDHSVALVWADGYRTWSGICGDLESELAALRPTSSQMVGRNTGLLESAAVEVYVPPDTPSSGHD